MLLSECSYNKDRYYVTLPEICNHDLRKCEHIKKDKKCELYWSVGLLTWFQHLTLLSPIGGDVSFKSETSP